MPTVLKQVYGPILIGVFLNVLLYGIMIAQTYYYFVQYKKDRAWIRWFVALLLFADTLNTIFNMIFLYQRLILFSNDPAKLGTVDWLFGTDPAMGGIIAFLVQSFFSWRIKVVTGSLPIALLVWIFSFAQLLGAMATAIASGILKEFVEFHRANFIPILWHVFSIVADATISIALVSHLRRHRTGFATTDDLITRITRLTVSTGTVTAVFTVIELVTFLASNSGLYLALNYPRAKLYTNSLLSSLNSRSGSSYSEDTTERSQTQNYNSSGRIRNENSALSGRRSDIIALRDAKHRDVEVTVTRTTEVDDPGLHKANILGSES